ncbi:extensin family protein [Rhizorhabdus dicambivorans]|uniref:Extensin n=1 Tax=Rhizorhabdus dicambivorans TaxID=1850238 RepID=A0A2A4G241_9SPHN|nr:extensin family protein [Rhizorhabdus dicambivorans]ATE64811.1 extensin [Rhizorhabdus dicambivorans]PCE44088.1 extensin [Rhizorhabdus dicambivorans]
MAFARTSHRLFLTVFIAALGLAFYSWAKGHPQDLPWTPLSLGEQAGRFTNFKIAGLHGDFRSCRRLLDDGAEAYAVLPPARAEGGACGYDDGVRLESSPGFGYAPRAEVSCPVAIGLFLWERQVVQPAALRHFGRPVTRVDSFGSYACRPIRGGREGRWSEHARANAIDIAGFRLSGGRRISVAGDWRRDGAEAAFLREVRNGACRMFATVLSPDYNAAHRDHLHLDQAARGGWSYCR